MTALRLALALAIATIVLAPRSPAQAQDLAGALSAGPIIADGDVGGGMWLELWAGFDWLRIGGMTGVTITPSARDSHNRLATPLAVSVAAIVDLGDVDFDFRLRGGMWGGSTQEVKMTAGGFVGGALFLDVHLGGGASLGGGLEVWGFLGAGETWAIAPSLTLTFGPAPTPPAAASFE